MKNKLKVRSHILKGVNFVTDIAVLSIIWIMGSLPILTMTASSKALIYAANKNTTGENINLVEEYLKSYKEEFLKSFIFQHLLGVIWVVSLMYLMLGLRACNGHLSLLMMAMFFCLFELIMLTIYSCSFLAYFDLPLLNIIKYTFLFTHLYFIDSLKIFIILLITILCFIKIPFLVIFLPGILVVVGNHFVNRVINKYLERRQMITQLNQSQLDVEGPK